MCPWCFFTPACPCRRGGGPPSPSRSVARAIVAVTRRVRRLVQKLVPPPMPPQPSRTFSPDSA